MHFGCRVEARVALKHVSTVLRVLVDLLRLSRRERSYEKRVVKFEAPTLEEDLHKHARRPQNRFVDRNIVCGGPTFLRLASDHRR